ncbi:MAG: tetratricopeptide repeat protein, partial [Betaproteobacteria bacterium]|nr:tetratricopeptide repeat protein [Betaproteobacteria bacterium]
QAGEAFRALRRGIARSRGFSLFVCTCDAPASRDQFIANLSASMPAVTLHRVALSDADDDVLDAVVKALADGPPGPVMVVGVEGALADDAHAQRLLGALNLRRAEWPLHVPEAVVFWLPRRFLGTLTTGAPDFFDWRSDTIAFPELTTVEIRPLARRDWEFGVDPRLSAQERAERLRELRARIAASSGSQDEYVLKHCLAWWDEVAELELVQGHVDEALRIRTEEQLPVYERLGDVREKAVTMGKIADILHDRGQLDEALRIRTEEQLPVYERLGDQEGIANVLWKIARVELGAQQYQEAYEHLARSYDILLKLGRLDGICMVGLDLGQLLCAAGQRDQGLVILRRSEEGFRKLQWNEQAERTAELIRTFEAS